MLQVVVVIDGRKEARARIVELLDAATEAVERVARAGRNVDAKTVSEAGALTSRSVGFVEACALLYPGLVTETQARLETLESVVGGLRIVPNGAFAMAPAEFSRAAADRRGAARPGDVPRRQNVRRLVPDRRLVSRRILSDRRGG